ncbi:N-acetyltransferase [Tamlana sp. s12]|uniref:GNAT family N-acetyltransferase n=1 Tax=Tamlana sp. s12 TaxID=1630406 RepID=UPI0007FFC3CC|nr:GNAT family N-acetyltransferase [Tamlana sp. s12]OBQ55359.1 phosphinothricin acetyltransferase [Tamlana sp. s12]QQY80962.1 N-acetyltransferase [Tamlana sp. s12]
MIRELKPEDIQALLDIYNYYVLNSVATFDIDALTLDDFQHKIDGIKKDYPFLVYEENNEILGYAYGSRFRPKPAYSHVVESTVYVKHGAHGKQIGTKLYADLLKRLKQNNFHTVLGVLTIPNDASVKLHEHFGFEKVAHLNEVGFKFDTWQHVGIWQLKLK